MKKIYFFLALLLPLLGSTKASAEEIVVNINSKTGEWTAGSAATWAYEWATYSEAPRVTVKNDENRNNMAYWDKNNIQFYNSVSYSGTSQSYTISVSNGYNIKAVELDFLKWHRTTDNIEGFVGISFDNGATVFQNESFEETVHASISGLEETTQVKMIVSGANPALFANTSNFVVTVEKLDERTAIWAELIATVDQYEVYVNRFITGTQPGNYSAEEVEAFRTSIQTVKDLDQDIETKENISTDDLKALNQAIKDTYEAVLASRAPMTLADGYYRLKTAMQYTTTTEDPETLETITTNVDKYMYSVLDGSTIYARWGSIDDIDNDCPSLWKVTNQGEGTWKIENMATEATFNNVQTSKAVTMSLGSENLMSIDPLATIDNVTYTDIRVSSQAANNYFYLHQAGHGSGKGTGGNVVGYATESKFDDENQLVMSGTEWVFVPVSDEVAQTIIEAYKPIQDEIMMRERYKTMLADAKEKLALAKDLQRTELITDVSQITFVKTDPSEGSEAAVLDNDAKTYWHSDWHNKDSYGRPSLTIELAEPIQNFTWDITRRASVNDHVTLCNILAGNDSENLSVVIADQEIGNASNGAHFETEIDLGAAYKYVKFEFTASYGNSRKIDNNFLTDPEDESKQLVYAHFAEFHMVKIESNPNAQANFMGDLATNLEKVINDQKDTEIEDLTMEQYNALKDAYDAFMAKFTDPTELRQTLAARKGTAEAIKVGTNPGFWASDTDAAAYSALYNEAKAYDEKGDYTPEKSASYVAQLNEKAEALMQSAIGIQEGKWYRIRFASEEDFDTNGWNKAAGYVESETNIDEPLFGKYITAAEYQPVEGSETGEYDIISIAAEDVPLGENVFFDDDPDILDQDLSLFRFINVGDSAFILQNKGTGMFLKAAGGSGAVTFSVHPSLFNVSAAGYGLNLIAAKSITGEKQNYLHAQKLYNILVTWNATEPGSASTLYIEEAENVESDYEGNLMRMALQPGAINTLCFPVSVAAEEGMYDVKVEGTTLTLFPIAEAVPGRPFIYVLGELSDYDEEAEPELVEFTHGYELVTKPQTGNSLKGTFATITLDRGEVYAKGNTFVVNDISKNTPITDSRVKVDANRAYITTEEGFDMEAELKIVIDLDMEDGIAETLEQVAKSGPIYTIDGRLVSRKGNVNDLTRYGRGIYILNGVKIAVK